MVNESENDLQQNFNANLKTQKSRAVRKMMKNLKHIKKKETKKLKNHNEDDFSTKNTIVINRSELIRSKMEKTNFTIIMEDPELSA